MDSNINKYITIDHMREPETHLLILCVGCWVDERPAPGNLYNGASNKCQARPLICLRMHETLANGIRHEHLEGCPQKTWEQTLETNCNFRTFSWSICENSILKSAGNYSAPIWNCNFSICLWDNPKTLISMMSGLLNMSPSPKANITYLLRHQDTLKIQEKPSAIFRTHVVINIKNSEITAFINFRKDGRRKVLPTSLIKPWKSWTWDQYLPGSMKWKFGKS